MEINGNKNETKQQYNARVTKDTATCLRTDPFADRRNRIDHIAHLGEGTCKTDMRVQVSHVFEPVGSVRVLKRRARLRYYLGVCHEQIRILFKSGRRVLSRKIVNFSID